MKSSNLWRVIWVVGIYALLGLILYLVIIYKVEWENKDLNTYLYIYECNHDLCTSTVSQKSFYNKILCEDDICPYIEDIVDDNLILSKNNVSWIYNYIDGKTISNNYVNYRYIGNDMYVVGDNSGNYGVINDTGEIIVSVKYNYIDDYNSGFISYIKDNLYGIVSEDNSLKIDPVYDDIVLINSNIFAGKKDNVYYLYSYNDINNENANKYDFVYAYDDVIFVIKNKKIDILNTNLNSTLLMKINTFYEYTEEKERDSLDIYSDGEFIYFKVFINETDYTDYKYNINDKKLM